jgi:putative transposase
LKATQDYELIRSFVNNKKAKQVFSAYVRLGKFFVNIVHVIPGFQKHIYFIVDNFSKKILSWKISDKVSALVRRETIGEALKGLKNEDEHIVLITDGGPENSFKEYLEAIDSPMTHRRALIDIQCSNSLIEAHNKVIKYNYLFKMSVVDGDHLTNLFPWIANDFNSRPHI